MRFRVISGPFRPSRDTPGAFLIHDNWDDYSFKTLFRLWVFDGTHQVKVGNVKIATIGMEGGRVALPESFTQLGTQYFSLGTDEEYYARLRELGDETRETVLAALRDIAYGSPDHLDRLLDEPATRTSLMRGVELATITGQFRRIAHGGADRVAYRFVYHARAMEGAQPAAAEADEPPPLTLGFDVHPHVLPPTNVHVLIGRNGVGKSHILNGIAHAVTNVNESTEGGAVPGNGDIYEGVPTERFANVVSVSFSAFDELQHVEPAPSDGRLTYAHVGLKKPGSEHAMSPDELAEEFAASARECRTGSERRFMLWKQALETLETDPIFQDANVAVMSDTSGGTETQQIFRRLSSGHKIVLLTMSKLVQHVAERSLVLVDEPEAHLHPPLLSAFVRALSDLLVERNGVAIIATHSPVVLQEVPRECVWTIRRFGYHQVAERPDMETFGENVGVLTREVFGLEVTKSGFHRALAEAIAENLSYDEVLARFNQHLGMEGRALTRAAIAHRDNRGHR